MAFLADSNKKGPAPVNWDEALQFLFLQTPRYHPDFAANKSFCGNALAPVTGRGRFPLIGTFEKRLFAETARERTWALLPGCPFQPMRALSFAKRAALTFSVIAFYHFAFLASSCMVAHFAPICKQALILLPKNEKIKKISL